MKGTFTVLKSVIINEKEVQLVQYSDGDIEVRFKETSRCCPTVPLYDNPVDGRLDWLCKLFN